MQPSCLPTFGAEVSLTTFLPIAVKSAAQNGDKVTNKYFTVNFQRIDRDTLKIRTCLEPSHRIVQLAQRAWPCILGNRDPS